MTSPFIIWLNKSEMDEMISTFLNSRKITSQDIDINNKEKLQDYLEELLIHNKVLVNIVENIEPLNPLQKNDISIHRTKQNCKHHKEELERMSAHCSNHNRKSSKKIDALVNSLCEGCSRMGE